jgi:hypothetical protein
LNDEEIRQRAREARELMEHPAFTRIVAKAKDDAARVFLGTDDPAEWQKAHSLAKAIARLAVLVQNEIDAGKVLAHKLEKARHRAND